MPAKKHRQEYLTRRRILAATGATGAATLAGCFGGDDDASDLLGGDFDEVDIEYPEDYEDEMNEVVPSGAVNPFNGEYIFNPYHHAWNAGDAQETMYEYLSVYNTDDGEFIHRIAEGWEIDEETRLTTVEISDEYGWSNGTPITAGDFVTALKLEAYMEMGLEQYVDPEDGIRVVDDHTFEIEPREEYVGLEKELWLNQWAEMLLNVSEEQFGPVVEEFESASSDDEIEDVQRDLVSVEPHWDQILVSGPFMFVEANEEYADQVPNQHHPVAQDWDFYLRHGQYEGEQGLQAGEVDWEHNDPTIEDLPDKYDEPPVSFSGQTFAIIFGRDDEYIRDYPEVRQAIAYAVDMEHVVDVASPGTPVDTYSAGIDSGYVEHFVEEDVLDAMPNYAAQDTDAAQELLEDVGFSYEDGAWYTPDGDEWTLNFPVGDWFRTSSQIISDNLAEFGIDMDHYVNEMPTWQSESEADLDFDLTVHLNYGMARQYHAHSDLYEEMYNPNRGILTERNLFEEEVEVSEVGNPDGGTETINIPDELDGLATAEDEDEAMEHATKLAWVHNQLLPAAMVHPWSEHYWVNVGDWDFDLESDAWLTSNRITHYLLEHGLSPE